MSQLRIDSSAHSDPYTNVSNTVTLKTGDSLPKLADDLGVSAWANRLFTPRLVRLRLKRAYRSSAKKKGSPCRVSGRVSLKTHRSQQSAAGLSRETVIPELVNAVLLRHNPRPSDLRGFRA